MMAGLLSAVIGCLIIFSSIADIHAQHTATLSKREVAVKRKLSQLNPGAHISIVRLHAPEEFGNFVSYGQDDFTFYDVDQKTNIVLYYEDVKRIKDGYGGYNSIHHKHIDPTKRLMGAVVGLGVIVGLILAAAVSQ